MKNKEDGYSPTGVLEDYLRSSDSETCSSKDANPDYPESRKTSSRWSGFFKLLNKKPNKPLSTVNSLNVLSFSRRMSSSFREIVASKFGFESDSHSKSQWKNFALYELEMATNYFSPENQIGKGGYAQVYKGRLRNGRLVAIKRIMRGTTDEIIVDFLSEIGIMAHVNHPNTAQLIGYCIEGGFHMVLELSPNGSLASLLYGCLKEKLIWGIRYKIAVGTARGLVYLHEDCQRRIIHRDIKAANILLAEDFEPQICDFGLAKWLPEKWTHHTVSKFEGTFGYLAPEYLLHGIVDEKTDVFAFGVLLLELVTGRRALDYSHQSLVLWARPLLKKSKVRELVDPSLLNDYDSRQMNLMLLAASLCIQQSSIRRPTMNQVLGILYGDSSCLKYTKKGRIPILRKACRKELMSSEGKY